MRFVFFDSESSLLCVEPLPGTEGWMAHPRTGNETLTNMRPYSATLCRRSVESLLCRTCWGIPERGASLWWICRPMRDNNLSALWGFFPVFLAAVTSPFGVLLVDHRPLVLTRSLFSSQVSSLIINLNDIPVEAADGLEASWKITSWWHPQTHLMSCHLRLCLRINCK